MRSYRCPKRTWTESSPAIRAKAALTERARMWACRRVGEDGDTVEDVRLELGVGWGTVMRAVREYGEPLVDDPDRLAGVLGLGVDESAFLRATALRSTQFVTGVLDLTPGRPAPARRRAGPFREGVRGLDRRARAGVAGPDRLRRLGPLPWLRTALRTELPVAVRVLDAFHVVRLGFQALDEVRRRVQQETLGHRGYKADPLYGVRRALRRGEEKLSERARARIEAALAAGDPDGEVAAAWWCAQALRRVYLGRDPDEGRRRGADVIEATLSCPVPEVARLGRTLRSWRVEFLAYFDTERARNGPTEAMNLLIEKIRRIGHGYRNFDNYRRRLLLGCGVQWTTVPVRRIRGRQPALAA